ncbi:acetyl-CoA C-acetyltransferase [Texcoconibacillus texcoconensis]|uniref:acetyl-CoA C-acetyltransferase n=1 Tax=Texcoconibacillus texcoconensis TaxID=1095777 RepID=A0A840QS60_9BACI|nr:acetyl-CoA C-acetyltransferase [Texcoconibacillus texcoconensis]MBB5174117.1 acetyl-CoA C-acetyltransferase [Texcoconibacillus texcoconensis]
MKTVVVSGARTPFAKLGGKLSSFSVADLGGKAIRETLNRGGVKSDDISHVLIGSVLQGGQGQLPSRQAMHEAGIPWHVESETINKVCASGMRSVTLGHMLLQADEASVVVAGGIESMSHAPFFVKGARFGFRMGEQPFHDLMVHDGLTCSFTGAHMGKYGNDVAREYRLTRERQDEWAYRSHERAVRAIAEGNFAEEIAPVEVPQRKGDPLVIREDEGPRADTNIEKLSTLKPVFASDGTITAGNAPAVNDGAAAMLLTSDEHATAKGWQPLAEVVAHSQVAVEPENFPKTPGLVINKLLKQTNMTADDVDLFEINEAFSAVVLASSDIAELNEEKINVNGGAIALGHPIGASGARIILTLIYELRRRGGGIGVAAICSGGGQGDAVMVRV